MFLKSEKNILKNPQNLQRFLEILKKIHPTFERFFKKPTQFFVRKTLVEDHGPWLCMVPYELASCGTAVTLSM